MIQDIAGLLRENLQLIKEAFADAARTREEEAKFYSLQGGKGGGAARLGGRRAQQQRRKRRRRYSRSSLHCNKRLPTLKKSKFSSSSTAQLLSHSALGKGAGSLGSDGGGASEYSAVGSSKSIKSLKSVGSVRDVRGGANKIVPVKEV